MVLRGKKMLRYCSSVATYKISYHRTQLYRLIFLYRKHSAPVSPLNRLFSPMRAKIILKKTKLFFSVVPLFKTFAIAERRLLLVFLGLLFCL